MPSPVLISSPAFQKLQSLAVSPSVKKYLNSRSHSSVSFFLFHAGRESHELAIYVTVKLEPSVLIAISWLTSRMPLMHFTTTDANVSGYSFASCVMVSRIRGTANLIALL